MPVLSMHSLDQIYHIYKYALIAYFNACSSE